MVYKLPPKGFADGAGHGRDDRPPRDILAGAPALTEGIKPRPHGLGRPTDRQEAVCPAADPACGLGGDGGAEDVRGYSWPGVQLSPQEAHVAVMRDRLTGPQRPDEVHTLPQAGMALRLRGPGCPEHPFVQRLPAPQRHLEAAGE